MTTDNTQELDEILEFAYEGETSWVHDQLDGTSQIDEQLQYIEDHKAEAKQAILAWHNKQIEAVLDRLQKLTQSDYYEVDDFGLNKAIEAERMKLREGSSERH